VLAFPLGFGYLFSYRRRLLLWSLFKSDPIGATEREVSTVASLEQRGARSPGILDGLRSG